MKRLVLTVALVALLVAAVFGGQALASSKSNDISISEETSEDILFNWGGSYWGSPLRMKSFQGCFNALDYPNGYNGNILEESYPEIRHVSVTVIASNFDMVGDDSVVMYLYDCGGTDWLIDIDDAWGSNKFNFETFEFNTDHWIINLYTTQDSKVEYSYTVTVTYPL